MRANSACWRRPGLRDTDDYPRFIDAIRSLPIDKAGIVCVTLGKRGALVLIDGKPLIIPGRAVSAVDTTGAGDCFVGAVAAQLAGGKSIRDALALRQRRRVDLRAADGSSTVDADESREVEAALSTGRPGE